MSDLDSLANAAGTPAYTQRRGRAVPHYPLSAVVAGLLFFLGVVLILAGAFLVYAGYLWRTHELARAMENPSAAATNDVLWGSGSIYLGLLNLALGAVLLGVGTMVRNTRDIARNTSR